MVKIRLRRDGAKKAPFYTLVVADSRYPMDGKFIEKIGTYDPMTASKEINVDLEKVKEWVNKGARLTETAKAIVAKAEKQLKEAAKEEKTVKTEKAEKTTKAPAKAPVKAKVEPNEKAVEKTPAKEKTESKKEEV